MGFRNPSPLRRRRTDLVLDKARGFLGVTAESFAITSLVLLSRCVLLALQVDLILYGSLWSHGETKTVAAIDYRGRCPFNKF